jgi:N-glycosylase/DNA lyase
MVKMEQHPGAAVDTAVSTLPELPLDVSSTSSNLLEDISQAGSKVEDRPESTVVAPLAQRSPDAQEPVCTEAHLQDTDDLEGDEPLEEYSRAIPNPDRVVLLRQTKTKIWIVSVLPDSAVAEHNESDGIIKGKAEREERDRAWFADYFQLPNLSLGEPSSTSGVNPVDHPADPSRGEDRFGAPPLPLPLMEQYAHWKELDPLLFGKAYDRDELPKGVRVVRQEGWECLVS